MAPSFCRGRRITRRGEAYSLKPFQHGVSYAFSVFPSVRLATAALQRPRGERWRHIRAWVLAVKSGTLPLLAWARAALLGALPIVACAETPSPPAMALQPADLILRGGKVATVDPAIGVVEAIAIRGYRIAAVGDNATVSAHAGANTRVIELNGRLAIPGFIEGHGHFLELGRARQILDLTTAASWDEILGQVAAAVNSAEPGDWIFGHGWHQEKWRKTPSPNVDGAPLNDDLNAAAPHNPVYLAHASGHAAFANDAALAAAGIGDDTPNPPGGTIVRTANGRATGLLRENAQSPVEAAIARHQGRLTEQETERVRREQVRLAGTEALRFGVTSFHDAGASFADIDFLRRLEGEGTLPVRLYVMLHGATNTEMDARLPRYLMLAEGNDFLAVRSIKRQIDGALGAWLLAPYADMPGSNGLALQPVEQIEAAAHIALRHGFQLNTHAIGDRANREILNLYQRVWRKAGANGGKLRWRIEHAQHIHPDDIARFGQLGVIAAVQGVHCNSDGPWIPARLGAARAETTSYRWSDLLDAGAVLNNGADTPVESIDPIASFYASVSRMMPNGEKFYPGQAMTRREALKSYTAGSPFNQVIYSGSIRPPP